MKKINYVIFSSIPSSLPSSLQVIKTCENFAKNNYDVTVYNGSCSINDSIYISVRQVFCNQDSIVVPSAFTPNGDNINDTYKIKNKGVDINAFYISIYNRLGQRVFNSDDISFSWDGRFKGTSLQPQVFDYFIEMTCSGGKKLFKKGNITLIK